MHIEIISDVVCPWCFIGKRRLERALATWPADPVEIGWRPFALNPDMPAGGMDRAAYLETKFGGAEKAAAIYERVRQIGLEENIVFAFERINHTPNTLDAHRLIHYAAAQDAQDAVVEGIFAAYFLDGRDLSRNETLAEIAADAGLDQAETLSWLASNADAEVTLEEIAMAQRMGVSGVPCFVFERKYALSGAQEPAAFHKMFEVLRNEAEAADA